MKQLAAILAATWFAAAAHAGFVASVWGNDPLCQHRGTLAVEGRIARFDLSAIPAGTPVHRAVLRLKLNRTDYRTTIAIHPLAPDEYQPAPQTRPLALRPPLYDSFDATDSVRRALAAGAPLRLHMTEVPGWQPESTTLEIAREGPADDPTPAVAGLRALCRDGQTFITWREHEDLLAEFDTVTIENMEQKLLPLRGKRHVVYRVYASDKPITVQTLGQATLVAEVPMVLSMYYLDSVRTIEHPDPKKGEGSTPLVGGPRAKRDPVPAYIIPGSDSPLPRGSGLYVRTIVKPAQTWYAVVTAINGRESVRDLSEGNSLVRAIDEKPAPPAPVLQATQPARADRRDQPPAIVSTYNYWLEFPYSNIPRQLAVASRHPADLSPGADMCVQLGAYGSQPAFNARERGGGTVTICPPWDQDDPMFQGRHECVSTLRSYAQGAVHPWAQRRTLALTEWAARRFAADEQRITVVGQFALWALRHGDVFAVVISDAYGNFNKGREAQRHGWTWGPYPLGSPNWLGIDQWEYMNICKWVRENPTVELPYVVLRPTGASHVGDMGPWSWPEMYRALHDTKRAFTARHGGVWSGATVAGLIMPPRIRRNQSLPAFANCSLDGMPGDGDISNNGGVGGDGDVVADLNGWLLWDTDTIVDEPDRWEMTVWLYEGDARAGRSGAPADSCTVDVTPRRCQKFRAKPGQMFAWTNTALRDGRIVQSGTVAADKWGLVTIPAAAISMSRNRLAIRPAAQ